MKQTIKHLLNQFEYLNKVECKRIVFKQSATDDIKDKFRDMIHGTDFMPDDYRFSMTVSLLERMLEYEFDTIDDLREFDHEIIDSQVDIYNHDLIKWLASHGLRQGYCDDAMENLGFEVSSFSHILQSGQYLEIQELFNGIIEYINSEVSDE